MKLAILGADATTLALSRAVADRADLELTFLAEADGAIDASAAELQRAVARSAKLLDSWEDLLDLNVVDAVIVARGVNQDRRSDQLRKFAQVAMPVLMSHPVVDSMLLYYELDMIRRDTGAIIVPALPNRLHPAMEELEVIFWAEERSPIGPVELVSIERQMLDRSKAAVLAQFSQDVDLLRSLCGELNQVGAVGTVGEDAIYGNLSVQLTGSARLLSRWNVGPVDGNQSGSGRLTVAGGLGKATLEIPEGVGPWTLSIPGSSTKSDYSSWNAADATLKVFLGRVRGEVAIPDLLDAARSVELTETIGRSLARRRTIELHFEDHTEENTFKGKMAASGCLLLMAGLAVLFFVAVLDKARIPGAWLWPWVLAAVFTVFSLIQLLSLTFKK